MSEVEIRDELKDHGVVGVNRVTLKKEGKVIPTSTLFLTFGSPELPKEITVGYLKVKVDLFVPNPMRCFNCNKFGHTSQRCKVAAKCTGCGKDKHEGQCEGPKLCSNCNGPHASSAKDCPVWQKVKVDLFVPNPMRCFNCNKFGHTSQRCKVAAKCTGCGKDKHEGQCEGPKLCSNCNGPHASSAKDCPVWQKEKEIQRVRVEKRVSFPEARQLVEARMPTVVSGGKTYAVAASTKRESRSVQCQTSLTWVFSDRPLRTTESNVRSFGRPGSVSTGTQASSGKSRTVSAYTWVPCESAKCSSETDRGSADPPQNGL